MNKKQYLFKRKQLMDEAKGFLDAGNIEQFNAVKKQVEELDAQYEVASEAQANFAALQNGAVVPAAMQDLGAGDPNGGANPTERSDPYASPEYANAFMNYACRHIPMPAKFLNAAASTTSADAGAVIPTTMVKEIVRELRERGVIFQQMRHMNIQGGVEIPILDLKPTANWVGEGASDDQKLSAKETISFSYYGLECKISQSILVSIVTIEEFQALFVELSVEAIMEAVEKGAFNGTGSGQMLGVCKDPRVKNVVTLTAAEFGKWDSWKKKVFAKIKKRYQKGMFYMALGTFEGYIDGMVDSAGQPVGRTNYGIADGPTYRFGGKNVEPVEDDVLPLYDSAAEGDVVAVYMNMKDFVFNSNMVMTVVHWTDHDNNKKKTKVMLICDGKIADANGVILVKKGA